MRTLATFHADFPDDSGEDDRDRRAVPPGRAIASTLANILSARGWTCSQPAQHSFYGWTFAVSSTARRSVVLIQFPGPWLLQITRAPTVLSRFMGRPDDRADPALLAAVDSILSNDKRFSSVCWWHRADYESNNEGLGSSLGMSP